MTNLIGEEWFADHSSEDSFQDLLELESNLYSIIHYNNLSEIVASDLPAGYKIDEDKSSNEIIVSLNENLLDHRNTVGISDSLNETNVSGISDSLNETNVSGISDSLNETNVSGEIEKHIDEKSCSTFKFSFKSTTQLQGVDSDIEEIDSPEQTANVDIVNVSLDSANLKINVGIDLCNNQSPKHIEEIIISSEDDLKQCTNNSNNINKNKKRKVKTNKIDKMLEKECPKKWTSSMIKYYSKFSTSKSNFDSMKLIKKMRESNSKKKWLVNNRDNQLPPKLKNIWCKRCKQRGHFISKCTEPIKPLTCYMCGNVGHKETKCPQRKCLTCGRPNAIFVQSCSSCTKNIWKKNLFCYICNAKTHTPDLCPDVWRGFHMTTKAGVLVMPVRENLKLICHNCGAEDHNDLECYRLNDSAYVHSTPEVTNYVSVAQTFNFSKENLSIIMRLNDDDGNVLSSKNGYVFLQSLSNLTQTRLELDVDNSSFKSLTIIGIEQHCRHVVNSVCSYLKS